jgi:hypothetical protein
MVRVIDHNTFESICKVANSSTEIISSSKGYPFELAYWWGLILFLQAELNLPRFSPPQQDCNSVDGCKELLNSIMQSYKHGLYDHIGIAHTYLNRKAHAVK